MESCILNLFEHATSRASKISINKSKIIRLFFCTW